MEIEELLDKMGNTKKQEDAEQMMELLKDSQLYVPVQLPDGVTKEDIRKLQKKKEPDKTLAELLKGQAPQPYLLQDEKDNKYLPLFTSEKQAEKKGAYDIMMRLPFSVCTDIFMKLKDTKAMVVNPFTHNVMLRKGNPSQMGTAQSEEGKIRLTREQIPGAVRQQVEGNDIPFLFHHEKSEFMKKADEGREAFILEFYHTLYQKNNLVCPYTEEDFNVLYMAVTEEIEMARVTLPTAHLAPGLTKSLFLTWDKEAEEVHYFALVMGIPGEKDFIGEILSNGKKVTVQEAPEEGNEITAILEILKERKKLP